MSYSEYEACNCHIELDTSKAFLFGSLIERYKLVTRCTIAITFQKFNIIEVSRTSPTIPYQIYLEAKLVKTFYLFLQRAKSGPREERTIRTGQGICLFCIVVCPMCTLMKDRVHEV
jgi:hypothetical protein